MEGWNGWGEIPVRYQLEVEKGDGRDIVDWSDGGSIIDLAGFAGPNVVTLIPDGAFPAGAE